MGWEVTLFDFDGVVADTMKAKSEAASTVMQELGVNVSPEDFEKHYAGIPIEASVRTMVGPKRLQELSIEEIVSKRELKVDEILATSGISVFPGVHELLEALRRDGRPIGLVSGSRRDYLLSTLAKVGLADFFDVIVSSSDKDVAHGKPAPDSFLAAARRLGVLPGRCVVVEDGKAGALAAKRAQMVCVGVTHGRPTELRDHCDIVLNELTEFSFNEVRSCFAGEKDSNA